MSESAVIISRNIEFVASTVKAKIARCGPDYVVVVYAGKLAPDLMIDGARSVAFAKYGEAENLEHISCINLDKTMLIVYGMENMLGNRLDERLACIQFRHRMRWKIAIQEVPYVVDPWRFYFPYSCVDKRMLGYPHSYAYERAWTNFLNGWSKEDPCDPQWMAGKVKHVTCTDLGEAFAEPKFEVMETTATQKNSYASLKKSMFDSGATIAKILRELHRFAASCVEGHSLPLHLKSIYSPRCGRSYVMTDLKVDEYLSGEMLRIIRHSNKLMRGLSEDV